MCRDGPPHGRMCSAHMALSQILCYILSSGSSQMGSQGKERQTCWSGTGTEKLPWATALLRFGGINNPSPSGITWKHPELFLTSVRLHVRHEMCLLRRNSYFALLIISPLTLKALTSTFFSVVLTTPFLKCDILNLNTIGWDPGNTNHCMTRCIYWIELALLVTGREIMVCSGK